MIRSNVLSLLGEGLSLGPPPTQSRLVHAFVHIAGHCDGGDIWRRCFSAASSGLSSVLTWPSSSPPSESFLSTLEAALLLVARASRFPSVQGEILGSAIAASLLAVVRHASASRDWKVLYSALQSVGNLSENQAMHEGLLALTPWDTLVMPLGMSDDEGVIEVMRGAEVPQECKFEALRALVLLGLDGMEREEGRVGEGRTKRGKGW